MKGNLDFISTLHYTKFIAVTIGLGELIKNQPNDDAGVLHKALMFYPAYRKE